MENVKKHFDEAADGFDKEIVRLIPYYREMLDALVFALPFSENSKISVLDLGCGTGTVSLLVKKRFPNATITCVDMAANMLDKARAKLSEYDGVEYAQAEFGGFKTFRKYDAVLSSLALHHLVTDQDKKEFFKKIFSWLNPGGAFFTADVVLAATDYLQNMSMNKWIAYMLRSTNMEEINKAVLPKYKEEDYPSKLPEQLSWLAGAGFCDVDILWKYYNFAVYGGFKK